MLSDRLHVAVLCSKRAPGLDALLRHPLRGTLYDLDCIVSTESAFDDCELPVIPHPIRPFYAGAPIRDREIRRRYDEHTAQCLRFMGIDVVVTLGYLYVITEPLLAAFPDRILNVHDADVPRYPGLHATRDAIIAGERQTFSSVHIVTSDLDSGPVIERSDPFPVAEFAQEAARAGHGDIVRAYAYAQREWMIRSSWADLVVNALIATRKDVALSKVFV
ncbi:MAG: formyltransferase family protein [Thermoanaerobaculia bacterium]